MVGRKRRFEGISSQYIKMDPQDIKFDDFLIQGQNIFVLAHQPGIGKTYNVMKYLKNKIQVDKDFKFFYFTERHATINEHTKTWKKDSYSHWEGFDRKCENAWMKTLYKCHLNAKDICAICGKCTDYTLQFENTSRVFAPFNYLLSKDFKDNLPDIIFLDENLKQFKSYNADFNKGQELFQLMGRDDLSELTKNKDCNSLSKKIDIKQLSDDYKKFILELTKNRGKNKDILKMIAGFNIFDFYQYIRWESIYGYELKSYGVPSLYNGAFDAVTKGVPAVFMDATFNPFMFRYLLECFQAEGKYFGKKEFNNLYMYIFQKFHSNKETVLYRMRPENVMPKNSFTAPENWDHTRKWLEPCMKNIMDIYGKNNVGIITFKEFGSIVKSFGFDVEYYGNLRGTNVLEDKPVLVLIGSYLPIIARKNATDDKADKEYYEDLLSKHFLLKIEESDLVSIGIEAPEEVSEKYRYGLAKAKAYKYMGKTIKEVSPTKAGEIYKNPAEALNIFLWFDEIYQALHRNRGLRYPRTIFAYCWFPEPGAKIFTTDNKGNVTVSEIGKLRLFHHDIRSEFESNIEKIDNDLVNAFFDYLAEHEKDGIVQDIVDDILQHYTTITSTELTRKYKIHKSGGGADTIPITMLIRAIKLLKEKAKRWE